MSHPASSRKRSASVLSLSDSQGSSRPQLSSDSINPLSHTPSVLRQLQLAGLAETDHLPSTSQPNFPHRAWRDTGAPRRRGGSGAATPFKPLESDGLEEINDDDDEDHQPGDENADGRRRRRKRDGEVRARYASEKSPFRPLVSAVYDFLDRGDVTNAKRAFGVLARSHVHGRPVDIRRNDYWALGAEILMREGAESNSTEGGVEKEAYPAANIPRVREYFQDLIQRYPYNFKYRNAVSAIDFWPALLSYEVYQVHARHAASLRRLERESEDWEDDSWQEPSSLVGGDSMITDASGWQPDGRDRKLRQARDQLRLRTLDALREVAGRMDDLLEDRPYSHSREMLRLRGMVSLYIGDLLIPAHTHREGQMAEAQARREAERNNARFRFQKMVENGGRPDTFVQELLAPVDQEDGPLLPVFSSLPIREYRTAS
ncbi:hypothetical protein CCHL11_04849 [Colletotrichum chlorophyti]|uniref:RNA polymerase I-specific transcription initiation factor rrn11 n=1 Tax=Colletotrichum chlorophyti TaxID=708187 RepID=A0A1Q8S2C5_9PEZI|nr:hypothetical protein CCHL11_04849 [Colletotrichum chlorophyti]